MYWCINHGKDETGFSDIRTKYSNILFMLASLSQTTFSTRLGTWLLASLSLSQFYKQTKELHLKNIPREAPWMVQFGTPAHSLQITVRGWQLPTEGGEILPNTRGHPSHDPWGKSLWTGQPPQFKSARVTSICWASLYPTHVRYFPAHFFTIILWGGYIYSHFTDEKTEIQRG